MLVFSIKMGRDLGEKTGAIWFMFVERCSSSLDFIAASRAQMSLAICLHETRGRLLLAKRGTTNTIFALIPTKPKR